VKLPPLAISNPISAHTLGATRHVGRAKAKWIVVTVTIRSGTAETISAFVCVSGQQSLVNLAFYIHIKPLPILTVDHLDE
jgi:hypothetical protein